MDKTVKRVKTDEESEIEAVKKIVKESEEERKHKPAKNADEGKKDITTFDFKLYSINSILFLC